MKNTGFTLVELLVVITIIAFMGLMLIPAIVGLFNSGVDSQSYAMLTQEMSAARTLAIKSSCYVCLHIQQANKDADSNIPASIHGKFYMAVLIRNPFLYTTGSSGTDSSFYPDQVFAIGTVSSASTTMVTVNAPAGTNWVANQWSGYWVRILGSSTNSGATGQSGQICVPSGGNNTPTALPLTGALNVAPNSGDYYMIYKPSNIDPQPLPGKIAFGRLCPPFVVNGLFVQTALGGNTLDVPPTTTNSQLAQSFVTVNIIFSPSGTVVTSTPDSNGNAYLASVIPGTTTPLPGYFYNDRNAATTGIYTQLWPMPSSSAAAGSVYTGTNTMPSSVSNDGVNLPQPGTTAVTMVDFSKYSMYNATYRYNYMSDVNTGCPYLSINVNTGQMLPRK